MPLLLPTMPTVSLAEPEPGFWVASTAAPFLGTIEHDGAHFIVRDRFGHEQDHHTTLTAAKRHLRDTTLDGVAA
ncbi:MULTISPECIES: hypothetical protein [unclassified Frondihabitans]|uniref:hypothetical protein n=1 Tax=unclassified Frondihabitans TaxID=2626248 RepID=UPI000F4FD0B5|nr:MULTISPECIES: hypothetical protein [unclassified Frondihabitans]RPE77634.1 hypothetical protein EDF37_0281 [Frondihabitans sp. PhB153]RPF07911.1 hypothetical protein EDF39_0282 [Frondihabitans sp. PhB161]